MNGRKSTDDTKRLFTQLLLTCKNVSLYPEGHSISANSIRQFHESLSHYIRQYGDLKIEVERERVLCQGIEVHKGSLEEGTLPFTLFRDGIRWLEFTEGIDLEEIKNVLFIIQKYSTLTTEPEGDIVTAFWEAHFDHILYEADDFVTEQALEQEESAVKPEISETEESRETPEEVLTGTSPAARAWEEAPAIHPEDFVLTPEEKEQLQEMISWEEMMPSTEHLSMLLDLLLQLHEAKDFNVVLGVLSEEFDDSYRQHDFECAVVILDGIRRILDGVWLQSPPAQKQLQSFYEQITSDARILKPLEKIWSGVNAKQIEKFQNIFRHLQPGSAETLVRFLLLGQPSQLEKIVEETVLSLIRQDETCLDSLVNAADEKTAEKLIPLLARMEGDPSFKNLVKLARHKSAAIRKLAVKTIGQTHGSKTASLFELIDDPDDAVRRLILAQMGQSRNEMAEDFLLRYLGQSKRSAEPGERVKEIFATLGKCGSARAVPFLRDTLLHKKWMAGLKKSSHREGAALALAYLDAPEAREVIQAVSKSFHPGLRKIARSAMKESLLKTKGAG
ncbi:MAG TPA: HEAT repeat domain-containing protein [Smithella sp.]|nr:HEAT repeat domain-containing protein [Smithella sp.]HRS97775.1 HEAT repeat domain-containing protein [Smithella sp.]